MNNEELMAELEETRKVRDEWCAEYVRVRDELYRFWTDELKSVTDALHRFWPSTDD